MFKKFWISLMLAGALFMSVPSASAAFTLLPSAGDYSANCSTDDTTGFVATFEGIVDSYSVSDFQTFVQTNGIDYAGSFLACALKLGYVKFWMIPFFVIYALQFVIQLAGLIAVLMVVVGGYYYIAGGITDDKEKGKHIITYALGGFVLVLTSWFLVNLVLLALTS